MNAPATTSLASNFNPQKSKVTRVIPREDHHSLAFGLAVHFGPPLGFCAVAQLTHFNLLAIALAFFGFSALGLIGIIWAEKTSPSVDLAPFNKVDVIRGLALVFLKGIGVGGSFVALGWWCAHWIFPHHSSSWIGIGLTVGLADLGYYWVHRSLSHNQKSHRFRNWFRKNHSKHHSVEALDFFRGNLASFPDTALVSFQLPVILVGALCGLDLVPELVAYALVMMFQSTHHVNYTFNIGWLRYVFVDNHNHKLHHCPRGHRVNFSAVLSVWDRVFKSCYEDWNLSSSYMEKHRIPLPK